MISTFSKKTEYIQIQAQVNRAYSVTPRRIARIALGNRRKINEYRILARYSHVSVQLGPLNEFISPQPRMSRLLPQGIIRHAMTNARMIFQRGANSEVESPRLKKNKHAPMVVPIITIGCDLINLRLRKSLRLILSHLSS